ncbi:hypothetical protein [Armatimonas sp.]|uniref:hypothetical protein n=1 Tax=Armatimonas sp. TaxID=1872638 RepID=UPI00286D3196|nr:hypothetical protein [Armatimonas sp.]
MIRYKDAPALARASRAPEEQLTLVRDEVVPCQAQLARWKIVPWLLPLAALTMLLGYSGLSLALGLLGIAGLCLTQQERRLWGVARKQAEQLAVEVKSTDAVGPLLDFARWEGTEATACHEALERLLPRLDTPRALCLSAPQRAYLRHCAENQAPTVELTVAALLVLSSTADRMAIPIARKLAVSSSSQRIRDAAELCLEELCGQEI